MSEDQALLPSTQARKRLGDSHELKRRPDTARRVYLLIVTLVAFGWGGYCLLLFLQRDDRSYAVSTAASVEWQRCGHNLHCGRLSVPLDYNDDTAGKASIYMVKYGATVSKTYRLGTLFVNPGGPGGSGSAMVHTAGSSLSALTGGRYDIIGIDPRGVNMSTPTLSCFDSLHLESTYLSSSPLDPNPLGPNTNLTGESYISEVIRIQEQWKGLFANCASNPETEMAMKYSSTANIVRDVVHISDVIEGPGREINFMGYSYGTLIGSYLVNMYPDRVGRVLLDGVVNPVTWTSGSDSDKVTAAFRDVELVLDMFTQFCADAPSQCALAVGGLSAAQIRAKLMRWVDDLAHDPLPVPNWTIPTLLTSPIASRYLFQTLYRPKNWSLFATAIQRAIDGDGIAVVTEMVPSPVVSQASSPHSFWITNLVIQCIDSYGTKPGNGTYATPHVARLIAEAKVKDVDVTGKLWSPLHVGGCWQFGGETRGVHGRFVGPFNANLSNPILIVGNIADPITPLHNAQLVHRQHPGSALIVHQGMGHSSLAQPSLCTTKAVRSYFVNGALPKPGLNCYPEAPPFGSARHSEMITFAQLEAEEDLLRSIDIIGAVVGDLRVSM